MIAQRPLFCVVLRDGCEWLIEVEWPDGSIEHVCTFKTHSDAANWLKTHSGAWLQERMKKRAAEAAKTKSPSQLSL
jgi:hypothetical protein